MNHGQSSPHGMLATVVRVALVFGLGAAIWSVYRQLPKDEAPLFEAGRPGATNLRVFLRRSTIKFPIEQGKVSVQFYPINVTAARNEFESERRPGVRFDEFLLRLMGERQPVKAELDESGEASVILPPGKWWVHATVSGAQELTWRLPVNVTGREVKVDLTYENAYSRAKTF